MSKLDYKRILEVIQNHKWVPRNGGLESAFFCTTLTPSNDEHDLLIDGIELSGTEADIIDSWVHNRLNELNRTQINQTIDKLEEMNK